MRLRIARSVLLVGAAGILASCGGHHSTPAPNPATTVVASPTSLSLEFGEVEALSYQVLDSTNTPISPTPAATFSSANPALVTVTSSGAVCGGVFDANNIGCQVVKDSSGNPVSGTVNVTVTSDGLSTVVPIFVHAHVNSVVVSGPANPPLCISQNQTEQFTARAFSGTQDITSTVGSFTWSTGNAQIAEAAQTGVVTSRTPGSTSVVAAVGLPTSGQGQTVGSALFLACPPQSISLHVVGGTDTTFNVAASTAVSLQADVTDILGQPINSATLVFGSYVPSAAASSLVGSVTTPGAGVTTIVASCNPNGACNFAPGPNVNLNGTGVGIPVYSNPVVGTVTGTSATTVYVTGADNPDGSANKNLIPIDSTANTAGTAITLTGSPNSMMFSSDGTTAFLGSSAGLMVFNAATNAVTNTITNVTGKVLAVSPIQPFKVIASDAAAGKVFIYDSSGTGFVQTISIPNVTAADFDSDGSKAYFTNGSTVFEYTPALGLTPKTLSFSADGVAFTPQENLAYLGGQSILGLAPCNDTRVDGAAAIANILKPTPDGTHMIAAGSAGWADLTYTVNSNACPPTASNTVRTATFPAFVGTPTQITVASDDSNAYLTAFTGGSTATGIPFYHLADGTTGVVALAGAGGPLFSGGITQDAHSLYVGIGANGGTGGQVHRIDLTPATGPADAQQIDVSFNPEIVVVRPK
ncbi:MAG TPA: hypothetical protein VFQ00_02210 [Terriglobales bacterium]|nr:hypothetical protein [Terriglobales bacterium]